MDFIGQLPNWLMEVELPSENTHVRLLVGWLDRQSFLKSNTSIVYAIWSKGGFTCNNENYTKLTGI